MKCFYYLFISLIFSFSIGFACCDRTTDVIEEEIIIEEILSSEPVPLNQLENKHCSEKKLHVHFASPLVIPDIEQPWNLDDVLMRKMIGVNDDRLRELGFNELLIEASNRKSMKRPINRVVNELVKNIKLSDCELLERGFPQHIVRAGRAVFGKTIRAVREALSLSSYCSFRIKPFLKRKGYSSFIIQKTIPLVKKIASNLVFTVDMNYSRQRMESHHLIENYTGRIGIFFPSYDDLRWLSHDDEDDIYEENFMLDESGFGLREQDAKIFCSLAQRHFAWRNIAFRALGSRGWMSSLPAILYDSKWTAPIVKAEKLRREKRSLFYWLCC